MIKGLRAARREGEGGCGGPWVSAAISKKIKQCPKFKKLEAAFNYRSLGSPVARDRLNKWATLCQVGRSSFCDKKKEKEIQTCSAARVD